MVVIQPLFKTFKKIKMKTKKIVYSILLFLVALIFFILVFRNWDTLKTLLFGG